MIVYRLRNKVTNLYHRLFTKKSALTQHLQRTTYGDDWEVVWFELKEITTEPIPEIKHRLPRM